MAKEKPEMRELTDTAYYILLSLVEAKHGYLVMKTIESMTDGAFVIGPASMYTTIQKLLKSGLIELIDEGDKKKKTYQATDKGIKLLKQEVERRRQMVHQAEVIFTEKGVDQL
ncbi:hypothetical protein JNUCC1_02599 [Lentibacillus sp. JNUCC-1]|uniref:PadR family transcriptional regulator n=1 Tax=Lentibacillus sp. JNUCC-1 TaxID=2654513 RepID=UPI0012E96DF6|nr:PadR family transcriptional regulator [Lentibacillus sp. JNUCC-1]MUV38728.1 hypothetical protein [Lentibacillus sp. JNUCC-1]